MERREIYTLGIVGLTASVGLFVVWLRFRNQKGQDSPRGLSIQRASLRTASTRSFNEEEEVLIDEAPTILNALYLYSQDSAKQDFDLCAMCEALDIHERNHVFIKIKVPIPPLSNVRTAVAPLFYPGSSIKTGITIPVDWISLTQLSHFDIFELEALFDQFRFLASFENISGQSTLGITRSCFQQCLGPVGLEINLITEQVFKFFDRDNDLLITFSEFVKGMSILCKGSFDERVQSAFHGYDLDGDGFISKIELKKMFKAYFHLSMELVRDVVKTMETELVDSFDEFDAKPVSSSFQAPITSSGAPNSDVKAHNDKEESRILPSPGLKIQTFSTPFSPIDLNTSPVLINGKLALHSDFPVMEAMGQTALDEMVCQTFLDASAENNDFLSYAEFYHAAEKDVNLLAWFEALGSVF